MLFFFVVAIIKTMFLESKLVRMHSSSRGQIERNETRGYCVSHKIVIAEVQSIFPKKMKQSLRQSD